MVKAVVFDLGKVLLDFDYSIAARKISQRARIRAQELTRFIGQDSLVVRYESGLVSSQEFYTRICALTGYGGTFQEFGELFADIFTPIAPMIELQAALRERKLPTYVFSNTNELVVDYIRRNYPFFANFDGYILSYEHRTMKPEARLYEVVERQSGRQGAEILYLDDRPENVAAGAARGWQAVLHESSAKSMAAVNQLGLLG